ncbi:MAG: acetyl-CoA C-acyltransferase [Pseudomonas fluorescens]|nr:MAG: acetyl-CoA C-acyltransferase [Pseudomonas fluorescens]
MTKATPSTDRRAVIVGYARSPFTPATKGALAQVRADTMAAEVVKALLKKTKVKPADIEDLIVGCAFPEGEQGFNVARLIGFLAGLPLSVGGMTVNRFCGSSMQAVHIAAGAIATGAGEAFICAGVESMSRVPIGGFNPMPNPELYKTYPEAYMGMGETAENVAKKYKIARAEQDAFAVESQHKAGIAAAKGLLKDEIVPITTKHGVISEDGCLRPDTTVSGLGDLKPAFDKDGSVTAGTSSPLTDGSAAVLVVSEEFAKKHKLPILARIVSSAVSGCSPDIMGMGPVEATEKALKRAGLKLKDIDVVELNEAFSAQSLGVIKALKLDVKKVNLDGGAIALGHPLGATGARIVGKAASLLERTKGRYALATQCIGGGQGIATILERPSKEEI